jgi:hypothetical protein
MNETDYDELKAKLERIEKIVEQILKRISAEDHKIDNIAAANLIRGKSELETRKQKFDRPIDPSLYGTKIK